MYLSCLIQGLPKPQIKTEPMEESPEIEEFESQIMEKENIKQEIPGLYIYKRYRLLDSLVVECWLRVREVPG